MACTFSDIIHAATRSDGKQVRLPAETAGYLVLAAASSLKESECLDYAQCVLEASGAVTPAIFPSGAQSEPALRRGLAALLAVASSRNPALDGAARSEPSGLKTLLKELEAGLVPINRSAARRSLVRLHRQVEQAMECGLSASPSIPIVVEGERVEESRDVGAGPDPDTPEDVTPTPAIDAVRRRSNGLRPIPSAARELPASFESSLTPMLGSTAQVVPIESTRWPPQMRDPSLTPIVPPAFEPLEVELPDPPALSVKEHTPVRSSLLELLAAMNDLALDQTRELMEAG